MNSADQAATPTHHLHDAGANQLLKREVKEALKISSLLYKQRMRTSRHDDSLLSIIPTAIEVDEEVLNGTSIEWIITKDKLSSSSNTSSLEIEIPKVINKIFIRQDGKVDDTKDLCKPQRNALESWTRRNPGYSMNIYGLDDCKSYLKEHFHPVFLHTLNCIEAYAGKTNLCRAAIIYHQGGWYSDWMEEVKVDGLLDALVEGNPSIICPWAQTYQYERKTNSIMNAFFGAQPRHPSEFHISSNIMFVELY